MKKYTWIKAAGIRALKTFCQTAIAMIGTSKFMGDVNWLAVGSASLIAAILSILMSIAGLPEVKMGEELEQNAIDEIEEPDYDEEENDDE